MLAIPPRRLLTRPKSLLVFALTAIAFYSIFLRTPDFSPRQQNPSQNSALSDSISPSDGKASTESTQAETETAYEPKEDSSAWAWLAAFRGNAEERLREEQDRRERKIRTEFEKEQAALGQQPGAGALYGNTLATLVNKTTLRKPAHAAALKGASTRVGFSADEPLIYDPYPSYNAPAWTSAGKAEYVACAGPDGAALPDIQVFGGTPHDFPKPSFGSYDLLNMDGNLCFERRTRLSPYGYSDDGSHLATASKWMNARWGQLQEQCVQKNAARFDLRGSPNPYLSGIYDDLDFATPFPEADSAHSGRENTFQEPGSSSELKRGRMKSNQASQTDNLHPRASTGPQVENSKVKHVKEERTALLIRTFTGKDYSENDKHIIRSLVTELSLRTGGLYQVFLLVQVKDTSLPIWEDEDLYEYVLQSSVPSEFVDMTILWNDNVTQDTYQRLEPKHTTVHVAQWLSVQKFSQEFPEFDYIWNWELDSRVIGHHYDFLEKLVAFAKKQPRRSLWERNERYYIPSVHGDYDTDFRKEVENRSASGTIWGPPELPFINPIGPKPPVRDHRDDDFEWGVGEEADLITVAPIFNPINSSWIGVTDVWGYNDSAHPSQSLPRRTTIITQSRVSKRLLDIMHVENLRGNLVSSEMTTQTVSLLHGLKAVYAPMPIFFDRQWPGESLVKWFNGGPNGESGRQGSAMGWGREGRFGGSTWYFRADPPQRMYTNWMGWEDTGMGGPDWEEVHGRPCLPPMLMHPIKEVIPTEPGHSSESRLPYA
ncbi:hypothetical protein BX600DRAFT_434354 [Xylariales sp. PMI_506]|nr:hypothetical protein BX600DRAFT_434354 [Xylariales sp. PMI_506]